MDFKLFKPIHFFLIISLRTTIHQLQSLNESNTFRPMSVLVPARYIHAL